MLYTRLSGINFNAATETFKANWLVRAWHIFGFNRSQPPVNIDELRKQLEQAQDTLSVRLSISPKSLLTIGAEWLAIRKEIEQLSLETNWHLVRWDAETQKYINQKARNETPKRFAVLDDLEEIGHHYHLSKLISLAYSIHLYENPRLITGLERPHLLNNLNHFQRLGVFPQVSLDLATSLARSLLDDYGCTEEVLSLLPKLIGVYENTQHRSRHSINQLTRYQTATDDLMMDYLTEVASVSDDNGVTALFYSPDDQREAEDKPEPLKLPLFMLLSVTLVDLLGRLLPKKATVANFKNKQEKALLAS